MAMKGPILTPGKKKPMPIKPSPKGGKNPKLPYRSADKSYAPKGQQAPRSERTLPRRIKPGEMKPIPNKKRPEPIKKRPEPIMPKPAGVRIRDLLYRAKPGEVKKQRVEQIRKSKYDQMEQIRKVPSSTKSKDFRYLDMMKSAGPAPKRAPRPAVDYTNMMKSGPVRKTKPVAPRRGGR